MKVVISEGGTANNVGSMALIENAIGIARKKYPNCDITVFCLDSKSVSNALIQDKMIYRVKVMDDLFPIPQGNSWKKALWLLQCVCWILYSRLILMFCTRISWAFCGRRKQNLQEVESADFVYCIGAERINDIYYKTALLSLWAIGTYIKMGKKLVHYSLTIGPVFNKTTISMAKKVLNRSYAVFVRDQKSFNILTSWKCEALYQFNSYDIALLQTTDRDQTISLLNEFGIESGFVGVSCINWLFRKASGPVRQKEYEKAIADALDYIVDKYNRQIVFTPTVVGITYSDDVAVGNRIISQMKNKGRTVSIKRLLTPVEMATLFTHCSFSIVTRMHAAILCSGAGNQPVISINYLYKLREYMKNILFEDYSIDIDYVNSSDLKMFIDCLMTNYEQECDKLTKRQNLLREKLTFDYMQI